MPEERTPSIHLTGGRVHSRVHVDILEKKNASPQWELNPNSSSSWPSYYTDCSKPTHTTAIVTAGITSSPTHIHFLQLTSLQSKPLCVILKHNVFLVVKGSWTHYTNPNVKEHFVSHT